MIRIAICGIRGRMGQTLVRLAAAREDVCVVGGVGRTAGSVADGLTVLPLADAGDLLASADVLVDFSSADATHALLERQGAALRGRALVVGTTGLAANTHARLDELARAAAVLTAANFSIGVNLLSVLTERVAAALPGPSYDIEVVETHHGRKADAPSGTALVLAEAAARGRGQTLADVRRDGRSGAVGARPAGEIGLHAVRGGGVVGEHRVLFLGERERIELKHEALDRALFADGALTAAAWIAGRAPGRYTMAEVLSL